MNWKLLWVILRETILMMRGPCGLIVWRRRGRRRWTSTSTRSSESVSDERRKRHLGKNSRSCWFIALVSIVFESEYEYSLGLLIFSNLWDRASYTHFIELIKLNYLLWWKFSVFVSYILPICYVTRPEVSSFPLHSFTKCLDLNGHSQLLLGYFLSSSPQLEVLKLWIWYRWKKLLHFL